MCVYLSHSYFDEFLYRIMEAMRWILDILFPPTKENLLIRALTPQSIATLLNPHTVEGITTLLSYRDERVRALLWQAKYRRNAYAHEILGGILASYVQKYSLGEHIVIPIPLAKERIRERGYNQVEKILHCAQKEFPSLHISTNILKKIHNTQPQTSLPRTERLKNLEGAFTVSPHNLNLDTPLLIIDDVMTTGATLREASSTLHHAGFKNVTCLALAHS